MPLENGTLTEIEFRGVASKLQELWQAAGGRKPCPSCGSVGYFIHPSLLANRSDTVYPLGPHTRFPTVAVYCNVCGYVDQYAAWVLGIHVLSASVEEKQNG